MFAPPHIGCVRIAHACLLVREPFTVSKKRSWLLRRWGPMYDPIGVPLRIRQPDVWSERQCVDV